MFSVRLVYRSATILFDELQGFSRALHQYINTTLATHWGINGAVYVTGQDTVWAPTDFRVVVADVPTDPTQTQVMGQHLWRGDGNPEGYVFASLCKAWNTRWDLILSHEVIEMMVDPWLTRCAQRGNEFWPVEVCDPVQDSYSMVGEFQMANFVTPSYYRDGALGPYDALEKLKAPFTVSPGGYGQVFRGGKLVPIYGGIPSAPEIKPQNSVAWSRAASRRSSCAV